MSDNIDVYVNGTTGYKKDIRGQFLKKNSFFKQKYIICLFLQKIDIDLPMRLPDWDFTHIKNRLLTFRRCNWDFSRVSSEVMAGIGFYYVAQENLLQCVFCCMEIKRQWPPDEDPLEKHSREHPICIFFRTRRSMFKRIKSYCDFFISNCNEC